VPSATGPDPAADPSIQVDAAQWPSPPDETLQSTWGARWVALAVAKPFVRSVTWLQATDALPHVYPHGGLFRADQTPKPIFPWLQSLRQDVIA
jgi:hypothetical protein